MVAQPQQPSAVEPRLVKELYEWADRLETKLDVASENGLFRLQNKVSYHAVLEQLTTALGLCVRDKLSPDEYQTARISLDKAQSLYDDALHALGFWERSIYVYGLHVLGYMIFALVTIIWIDLSVLPRLGTSILFLSIPVQMLLSGSLGAVIRSLWALWYRVDRMEFRNVWSTWFLLSPIMGALLGGVIYLVFFVGILVTTLKVDFANPSLAYLVAILAGYNWEWAQNILKKTADLFSPKES